MLFPLALAAGRCRRDDWLLVDREDYYGIVFVLGALATLAVLQSGLMSTWIVLPVAAIGVAVWIWRWGEG